MSLVGWQVPGYSEIEELGAGAQGRVILARHDASGTPVAIKYLASSLLHDTAARTTFRQEAELLKRVGSPYVARLIDYAETLENSAIIMEAVPGNSLRRVLDRHGDALAPEGALSVLKGSLRGLAAAHSVGVVHRDYKPANVLVQNNGQSKLVDFGIAVLTGQGGIMGTPAYMAPEQWDGSAASPATDVYAATCVFYECVTGKKPYTATTTAGLRAKHINAPVPVDGVPDPLRPLVAQGMAKNPGHRRWDVTAFIAELDAIATSAYGPDWERRGLIALGAATVLLTASIPVTLLGGALSPGAVIGTSAQAAGEAGHAIGGQGVLAKIGGAKAAGGAGAATAVAAMLAVFFWPESPTVGGSSSADYRAYFTRPSIVLANRTIPDGDTDASPLIALEQTMSPARVTAGTKVRLTIKWHARTPWGLRYLGPQRFQCRGPNSEKADDLHRGYSFGLGSGIQDDKRQGMPKVWMFRAINASPTTLPTGKPIRIKATSWSGDTVKKYDHSKCAWVFDQPKVSEFIIPGQNILQPGKYKVAPHYPIGISEVKATVDGHMVPIPPDSAGARVEGTLPTITVLEP